ncbi:hypothetical protein HU200_039956 [Digitaria exilis]|uniref:BTB domain-containing protein n=1 Tax=Digitaria exilis TaxID=1010633 RepID=A0A835BLA4_9POAL|nr:hypothetical protein HU200_039956 [Digitaria exilis]
MHDGGGTGEHAFEIVGYSLKRGLGVGKFVRSRVFSVGGFDWRFGKFLLRTELETDYICDDCLTIECNIVVAMKPQLSDVSVNYEIDVPACDIPEHFAELLDQKVGADVTFNVRGEIVEAHKVILAARSPVFKAQFFGQMGEKRVVTIEDMDPDIFKALLRFVYTGSMHGMGDDLDGDDYKDMIWHLLAAADKYAIDRLKLMC